MKKALTAIALVLLVGACGGGGGDDPGSADGTDAPQAPGATERAQTDEGRPDDVKAAPDDTINRPVAGSYVYTYETEVTQPSKTPRRSTPDAELTSKVTMDGDTATIAEQSTEGSAIATVKRRYTDEGILELSFETKTEQGSTGCTLSEPLTVVPLPLEKVELEPEPIEGEGTSCEGERTVSVGDAEDVEDASGNTWSTRKVKIENVVRSVGLTSLSTLTLWFSPDLGREVKTSSVAENINSEGGVVIRGETTTLLKSYPT
jgi:hypothetical protein